VFGNDCQRDGDAPHDCTAQHKRQHAARPISLSRSEIGQSNQQRRDPEYMEVEWADTGTWIKPTTGKQARENHDDNDRQPTHTARPVIVAVSCHPSDPQRNRGDRRRRSHSDNAVGPVVGG